MKKCDVLASFLYLGLKNLCLFSSVLLVDRPGDCPSPSWGEDLHPLVLVANRLRLGKSPLNVQMTRILLWLHLMIFGCCNEIQSHDDRFLFQFNLAIKDIPEVTHEAKKALAGQLPGIGRSMCVEISLKTSEVGTQIFPAPLFSSTVSSRLNTLTMLKLL